MVSTHPEHMQQLREARLEMARRGPHPARALRASLKGKGTLSKSAIAKKKASRKKASRKKA